MARKENLVNEGLKMGMSAAKVLLISLFLIAGMLLPGIVWQPKRIL
ncbi:hypothetical protein [Methanothrix soehngenii]